MSDSVALGVSLCLATTLALGMASLGARTEKGLLHTWGCTYAGDLRTITQAVGGQAVTTTYYAYRCGGSLSWSTLEP